MLYSNYTTKASALLCLILLQISVTTHADSSNAMTLTGQEIHLDDALFQGCYHNAFEGEAIDLGNGKWKAGPQTISRTKGVLTGQGTGHDKMELRFRLQNAPGATTLRLNGLNDRLATIHLVEVTLNGTVLTDSLTFPRNQAPGRGLNQRYYLGWSTQELSIPDGLLQAGSNTLTIRNRTNAFAVDSWPFVLIDYAELVFPAEQSVVIDTPEDPPFYYGLQQGVETHIWPICAYTDSMTLLVGVPLEYNFFATLPRERPLGTAGPLADEPTRPNRQILLHVWSDAPIQASLMDGTALTSVPAEGGQEFIAPIDRLIGYETPHPSQGVRLFLQADSPISNAHIRAWYSVEGIAYKPKEYPLNAIELAPLQGRETLNFGVSLWGGTAPEEPGARDNYIRLLTGVGFNQVFTGDQPELNLALKDAGFSVYPRFGWFGHQYTITDDTRQWAAITAAGQPAAKDFCPLAILEHADHEELGKFYARTRHFAALEHIDGLCVDFECAPVWCWCDRCLALFREETGHTTATRADLSHDGALADAYKSFGRRRNRDLLMKVKQQMQSVNPKLRYLALASANDVPAYWYDPRNARHSVRELTRFADEIFASQYCYEVPGGLKSVMPVIQTVRRYALESNRNVEASLIAPIAQTVSEFPRYGQASMRPEVTRLMILLTALSGGRSISFFRGDCFDGSQYQAIRQALAELIMLTPYLEAGYNRSNELTVSAVSDEGLRFETRIAQNLLSRFVWRPQIQYYHDSVQLLRDASGRDRLVGLFNYSDANMPLRLTFTGLNDDSYTLRDAISGEAMEPATRGELEGGQRIIDVPPHSTVLIRLQAE